MVCTDDVCIFVDDEFFEGFTMNEVETAIKNAWLWDLEVEGFSTYMGYLKIIAYHPEEEESE